MTWGRSSETLGLQEKQNLFLEDRGSMRGSMALDESMATLQVVGIAVLFVNLSSTRVDDLASVERVTEQQQIQLRHRGMA